MSTVANSPPPGRGTVFVSSPGRPADGSSSDTPTSHDGSAAFAAADEGPPAELVEHPRYKVLDKLGEGGMGVVYRAEHRVMGRVVVLKVLNTGVTASPVAVDRFHREVRLASRLNHANIVTAFDADEAGGLHFLVMEFVEGKSLDQVVRARGPLPAALACECARQAAVGLQHAHEKGMIHRDIKPHNLMLTSSGQVKILDFGLARVAQADGTDPASVTAQVLTQAHTLVGTPDFLSPEQARSAVGLDARSDLYSLGCTLYYLLAGRAPFAAAGAYAKMIAHVRDPIPDVTAARPDVPPGVAAVVAKLMAKRPEDRYQTAAEVATALLPFAAGGNGGALETPAPPPADEPADSAWVEANDPDLPALALEAEYADPDDATPVAVPRRAARPSAPPARGRRLKTAALVALVVGGLAAGAVAIQRHKANPGSARKEPAAGQEGLEVAPFPHTPSKPRSPASAPPPAPKVAHPPKPVEVAPPVPQGRKKHLLLVVPNDFQFAEYALVTDVLKAHGAQVQVVGAEKAPLDGYRYAAGVKTYVKAISPDHAMKDLTHAVLDATDALIVLSGDNGPFGPKGSAGPEFVRVVKRMLQKRIVGAAGSAIPLLGAWGLLESHEVSVYAARPTALEKLRVKRVSAEAQVVIDLPLVTAGDYAHTRAMVEEVLKAIPEHHAK